MLSLREAKNRRPSKRALRDVEITELIRAARQQRFVARFGARKMWLYLRRHGLDVARCTVERLMTQHGWQGALRGKRVRTTIPDENAQLHRDRSNRLWVADFTYVAIWSGTVYVAFVVDVFSRLIVGWRAATSMSTELVLDCFEHAVWGHAPRTASATWPGWCTTPTPGPSTRRPPSTAG